MEEITGQSQRSQASSAALSDKAADAFRGLWASLFYSGRLSGNIVLVCSSDRREGASTVACGLALAGGDPAGAARVALVDLNLRNPILHELLALKPSPGLVEAVLDGRPIGSVAQRVSAGLDVYPCGQVDGRSLEILRRKETVQALQTLGEQYDAVLVDAAPANHYPDAQVLAAAVKNVVLVARTEQTPREAVALAKKRLESGGGQIAGIVLNLRAYPIPRFLYRRV